MPSSRRASRSQANAAVASDLIERLQEAAAAFNRGDPDPLVALLHEDLEWRGVPRGFLWWKRTPA